MYVCVYTYASRSTKDKKPYHLKGPVTQEPCGEPLTTLLHATLIISALLYSTLLFSLLYSTILYRTILSYTTLHYSMLILCYTLSQGPLIGAPRKSLEPDQQPQSQAMQRRQAQALEALLGGRGLRARHMGHRSVAILGLPSLHRHKSLQNKNSNHDNKNENDCVNTNNNNHGENSSSKNNDKRHSRRTRMIFVHVVSYMCLHIITRLMNVLQLLAT